MTYADDIARTRALRIRRSHPNLYRAAALAALGWAAYYAWSRAANAVRRRRASYVLSLGRVGDWR